MTRPPPEGRRTKHKTRATEVSTPRDTMTMRRSRGYRIALILLSVACLGGAGYLGYRTFFETQSVSKNLKAAESSYDRGSAAFQQKNWNDAATRFDEAKLLADKATEALAAQLK